jgi:hypothetical protein
MCLRLPSCLYFFDVLLASSCSQTKPRPRGAVLNIVLAVDSAICVILSSLFFNAYISDQLQKCYNYYKLMFVRTIFLRGVLILAIRNDKITELLKKLSKKDLQLVTELMERLVEKNTKSNFPIDDEPTTKEDLDAIQAAHEAHQKGELIDLKDIENELRN